MTRAEILAAALKRHDVASAFAEPISKHATYETRVMTPAPAPIHRPKRERGTLVHVVRDGAGNVRFGFLRSMWDTAGHGDVWVCEAAIAAQALEVGDHVSYFEEINPRNGKLMGVDLKREKGGSVAANDSVTTKQSS